MADDLKRLPNVIPLHDGSLHNVTNRTKLNHCPKTVSTCPSSTSSSSMASELALMNTKDDVGRRVHCVLSELQQVETEFAEKINKLKDLDNELGQSASTLRMLQAKLRENERRFVKMDEELKANSDKICFLQKQITESESKLKEREAELIASKTRIRGLEKENTNLLKKVDELRCQIQTGAEQLRASDETVKHYEVIIKSFERSLESKNQKIKNLQDEMEKYVDRFVEYERILSSNNEPQPNLEKQLETAHAIIHEKDSEIAQLRDMYTTLETTLWERLNEISHKITVEMPRYSNFYKLMIDSLPSGPSPPSRTSIQTHETKLSSAMVNNNHDGKAIPYHQTSITAQEICGSNFGKRSAASDRVTCLPRTKPKTATEQAKECVTHKFEDVFRNLQDILQKLISFKNMSEQNPLALDPSKSSSVPGHARGGETY